ncbi:unnamed protein product [Chironomus riparius]|uniref:PWWP domain-containing protein n=1 Tax=Chironomus riparius TaxID=315576 RepID=A0A9N9RYD0_9DIPT|nr:unnamed protein product [Chironomus riparius]
MSESYKDGEVVWVKWRSVWWPGEVWDNSRVPEDILTSLRKPVIAFVKFFQEDSFEFVRSPNNICQYNTDKKMDFIKKGMDKYRSNNKIMTNFPADVLKAEQLTKGNVNILSTLETPTKSKGNTSSSSVTPTSSDPARKSSVQAPLTMSLSTPSPVTTKKAVGSYNSSVKVQNTTSSVQKSNDKKLTCTMCNFATDRMNLLMMHIKNHSQTILSRVNSPSSSLDIRKSMIPKISTRKLELDDGIAEDVRKIKESMKEPTTTLTPTVATVVTSVKKTRTLASTAKSTPKLKQSRQTRKDRNKSDKIIDKEDDKASLLKKTDDNAVTVDVEKSQNPKVNTCELKNELLADWLDEEDVKVEEKKPENNEIMNSPAAVIEKPVESPIKSAEKVPVEPSRSIRNIPKKQRVSEIYIQPEIPEKVELSNSVKKTVEEQPKLVLEDKTKKEEVISTSAEINKKSQQKASKRKHAASDSSNEPEKKKMSEDSDDKILMATAELLNETEVPKLSNVQSPSFHSNDIDKRNLPPKERNKRIFRAKNSPETVSIPQIPLQLTSTAVLVENKSDEKISSENESKLDEKNDSIAGLGGTTIINEVQIPPTTLINNKNDRQELILPHKKKQSSRLLTAENLTPIQEVKPVVEALKQEQVITTTTLLRTKKNRKSSDTQKTIEIETIEKIKPIQSPLREAADSNDTEVSKCECDTTTTTTISENSNRGQKRQHSKDSQPDDSISKLQPDAKKLHKSDMPRTLKACSSETICITSKGTLSVARRDSIKTTCANSVVVTSQVIISEATKLPIVSTHVSTNTCTDTISSSSSSPKPSISSTTSTVTLSPQTLKNALKIPEEKKEEMKKQGLLTIENNRTKLTPKGRQKFKEFQNKNDNLSATSSLTSITSSTSSSALNSTFSTSSICSMARSSEVSESSQDEKSMVIDEKEDSAPEDDSKLMNDDSEFINEDLQPINNDSKPTNEELKPVNEEIKPVIEHEDNVDEKSQNLSIKLDVDVEMESNENRVEPQPPVDEIKVLQEPEIVHDTQNKVNDNKSSDKETQQEVDETNKVNDTNGSESDVCNDVTVTVDEKFESTKQAESDKKTEIDECPQEIPKQDVEIVQDIQKVEEPTKLEPEIEKSIKEESVEPTKIKIVEPIELNALESPKKEEMEVDDSKIEETSSKSEVNDSKSEIDEDSQKVEDLSTSCTSSSLVTITTNSTDDLDSQSDLKKKPTENGNDDEEIEEVDSEAIEMSIDDPNSGSTGLIALQAETFGGPPNCFYLCRQIEDRYEPVDNQILVLNGQNALVPYDGISDLGLSSTENTQESLTALSQLSPNSNIIINTPNGQKIELNHLTIMALHEQADENGIASIELSGEQMELNINAILEALASQQDVTDSNESIIPGSVLLDSSDGPLIIESEIPMDVHHASVATQVSETLTKPIMSTTIAPEIAINPTKSTFSENSVTRMLNIEDSLASIGVTPTRANVPKSLELPITVTNPTITETVNHRKLAASLGADIITETFVVQQSTDNGSDD